MLFSRFTTRRLNERTTTTTTKKQEKEARNLSCQSLSSRGHECEVFEAVFFFPFFFPFSLIASSMPSTTPVLSVSQRRYGMWLSHFSFSHSKSAASARLHHSPRCLCTGLPGGHPCLPSMFVQLQICRSRAELNLNPFFPLFKQTPGTSHKDLTFSFTISSCLSFTS